MREEKKKNGFTLIELIIVFTLVGILVGLGLPQYKNSVKKARETVLKEDLFQMRTLIDQYYTDKLVYPPSLNSLVEEGYLRKLPIDPITRLATSWIEVPEILTEEKLMANVLPGIIDVNSGSDEKAIDGTYYNEW